MRAAERLQFVYDDNATLWDKIRTIATRIYHAADIAADARSARRSTACRPPATATTLCVSPRPSILLLQTRNCGGAPSQHIVHIREVRLAAGAEFVVVICGEIMTMPGLPAVPAANSIDVDESGKIVGLF